jgi:hypothetical protein
LKGNAKTIYGLCSKKKICNISARRWRERFARSRMKVRNYGRRMANLNRNVRVC